MTYSPEAEAFRVRVAAMLQENLPAGWSGLGSIPERDRAVFVKNWRIRLGELGLVAPGWPKQYGGGGLSAIERVILHEEFARCGAPTGGPNDIMGVGMLGPTLMVLGTEEQKRHFLPRILSGEHRWCQGYSEPNSGSDLASLGTRAVRDGDEWLINGQKIWTSEAHSANWIFVLCRTDPVAPKHQGITFLLCPLDPPGIEVRPILNMAGRHEFNEVFFTEARTSADNVVGDVNDGWRVANQLLAFERGDDATIVPMRMRAIADRLVATARQRGLTSNPGVRQQLARIHERVEILRYQGLQTLTRVLSDAVLGPESSISKIAWSELSQELTDRQLNVLGADALTLFGDEPLSALTPDPSGDPSSSTTMIRQFLGSRSATIASGSNEILRNIIAERLLGLPREPRAEPVPWNSPRTDPPLR